MNHPPKTIGRRLHYRRRASLCRRPWSRYQPRVTCPMDWHTYRLLTLIGWRP